MNRRLFLRNTGITGLGMGIMTAVPMELLAAYRRHLSPGSTIGVGLIGCNGMGWVNLTTMLKVPEVTCVALCDVDETVLNVRAAELEKINLKPALVNDYRRVLDMKEVDVVIIGTPDHWHCLMTVDACAAGKDVYVEKPLANAIAEAEVMVRAANRYSRVVQVGQWQRSNRHFQDAIAYVQSGKLGTIASARTWIYSNSGRLEQKPDGPVPAGVDYKAWLGPATMRAYNRNRFHYQFRWFWDYAGGLMTDWGVHLIDMVLLGMNPQDPLDISSAGGKFSYPGDARETPDTQTALFNFSGFQLSWEHLMTSGGGMMPRMDHGIAFMGNNGTLLLNRDGWEVNPGKANGGPALEAVSWQKRSDDGLQLHTANFVEAVKARNPGLLKCPIEAGARVANICQMGNIAFRTRQQLSWNPGLQRFDQAAANGYLKPNYANGYKFPKV